MTESPTGASRANRNAAIVVVVLVLALALGAVGMIVVSWRYLGSKARSARAEPVPSATVRTGVVAPNDGAPIASGATSGVARDAVGRASRAEWWRYQQAHAEGPRWTLPPDMDRTRVDPQTLFEPARKLARMLDPHAEMTKAFPFSTHMPVRGGTVDMTKPGYLYFTFGYDYRDPAKAPGEDQISGEIDVKAELGTLTASRSVAMGSPRAPLPDPTCPVVRAWQAAVSSGVPDNAVATLLYYDGAPFYSGGAVWSFRVEGHDELRREIDAATCALVKSWAKR